MIGTIWTIIPVLGGQKARGSGVRVYIQFGASLTLVPDKKEKKEIKKERERRRSIRLNMVRIRTFSKPHF